MMTPYCKSYLTAGCWSPTRAGVFYTCRCVFGGGCLPLASVDCRRACSVLCCVRRSNALSCLPLDGRVVVASLTSSPSLTPLSTSAVLRTAIPARPL
jgi:hypothetical protein